MRNRISFPLALTALSLAVVSCTSTGNTASDSSGEAAAPDAPLVVQPGAPGQPSRVLTREESRYDGGLGYTDADVAFMQGMIAHHAQALDMSALVPEKTRRRDINLLAQRIITSQKSEIGLMESWLKARGEDVPSEHAHHMMMSGEGQMAPMPGMLTGKQMEELQEATGEEFERLFLTYMISHHEGALTMVEALFDTPGAAQDSDMFRIADDVDADQRMEIDRMQAMLRSTGGS